MTTSFCVCCSANSVKSTKMGYLLSIAQKDCNGACSKAIGCFQMCDFVATRSNLILASKEKPLSVILEELEELLRKSACKN